MSCKSGAKTRKIIEIYQYTRKSRKQFETDEKLKVAKQASSKHLFQPSRLKVQYCGATHRTKKRWGL